MRAGLTRALLHPVAKPALFLLCLAPLAWLFYGAAANQLGANPAEALIRRLGDWTLRGLWLTLAVTPLRELTGLAALARFRRMLGVFSFTYASLHLLAYGWLDMGLDFGEIARDIAKRPFILMGFTAWTLMLPLAATSFNRAIKALGAPRWRALHRAVYAIAVIALMHFIWMRAGKHNFAEPAVYGVILAALLGWRLWKRPSAKRG
ncbi:MULTISPECIES: sulfite oxidase heme-binding subunit YedZ [Roseateles]|uniref:Protein-methionine-sulfoxide reductase heme-binding subunit MsrQ n=1 Tax=Pelomonas caseinilytica TaxID=2906763 RepID=A0ABS8XCW0_9BURK|nr:MULTISPECIES: protein-methionine-sulfoxide reductase heme-binding subunit MsrQ [unclassified Roseateles]MCE4537548.1 sulfoxide reductase heme-binding subunit YedZ [Pelomonas sp. P7]HEV6965134.1 protein-methionine-sulfoxide reductase heme-binding subunit MsrQ [Roseateles sp.]